MYLFSLIFVSCVYINNARQIETNLNFEGMDLKVYNESVLKVHYWEIIQIEPNVLRTNISISILQPINETWIQTTFYCKRTTYEQCFINLEFEGCKLLTNDNLFHFPLFQLMSENMPMLVADIFDTDIDIDFEIKCPFNGTATVHHPHFNISKLVVPMLLSGRYRADVYYRAHQAGPALARVRNFFEITNTRAWF